MISAILAEWQQKPSVAHNVTAWHTLPARPAHHGPFPDGLHPALVRALRDQGIGALYAHQVAAWHAIAAGRHPIVVTGTASGKTLCYNLPILDRALRDPTARGLYLFPTKALAQDQLDALGTLVGALDAEAQVSVATYDGDTLSSARRSVRESACLILTNPDMLHVSILPHHPDWADFFRRLDFVVVDEAHTYRGVFGSHVANVLRRLKRVARFYGASPQFILTSATIGNPTAFGQRLIEAPVVLIDEDGSPQGDKHFLIYNPPVVDPALGLRRSMLLEVVRLAADLIDRDIQTIVFGRARRTVEVMLRYLQSTAPGDDGRIRAYRSGYLPHLRREIEAGLRQGTVRTVVTTTALELGIDIGGMEAALLAGYPGTISGTWQQAGRAGRQAGASIAALVASPSPLDQFLARHPDYFFERSPEHALINPDNLLILLEHIRCATFELPFIEGEAFGQVSGEQVAQFLDLLEGTGELYRSGDRHFWMSDRYPAREVSLRSTSPEPILLQIVEDDVPRVIGQVDHKSAHWMVHPGAVYLHEGDQYLVEDLDLEAHLATLQARELDYYTEPQSETTVQLLARSDQAPVRGGIKAHGEVRVTCQIVGFRKVKWFTHEQLGLGQLDLPPTDLVTTGYWLSPSQETIADLRARGLWTNDPNEYGPNWNAQRQAARQRDGYRCQMCGTVERGSQHHVHHKVPFRAFDSYRQANQLANLTTLCPRCHRRAELSVHMRSGLAGLSFVLGHLAPLFLMCDARDIGVHADPRSPLAEGAPAVVVYDGVPAGIGFSQRLYQIHDKLMAHARDLVAACPCLDGCPSCVGPAAEGGLGGKAATAALVEALVDPALLREGVT